MLQPRRTRLLAPTILLALAAGTNTLSARTLSEGDATDGAPAKAAPEKNAETTAESVDTAPAPRTIEPKDYGRFERLGFGTTISQNGAWMAYSISRENKEQELRIVSLGSDSKREDIVVEYGQRAAFSPDGSRVGYLVGVSPDEREAMQKRGESPSSTLAIRLLSPESADEDPLEIAKVSSFEFSHDGRYLILRRNAPKGSSGKGDVIVHTVATGTDVTFGNVDSYGFADDTCLLAMVIDAADDVGNGVRLYNPESGTLRTLDSKNTSYSSMTWREDSRDLAILRQVKEDDKKDKGEKGKASKAKKESTQEILVWRDLGGEEKSVTFQADGREDFGSDLRLVTDRGLRWSDDGQTLFFAVKEREEEEEKEKEDKEEKEEKEEKKADKSAEGAEAPASTKSAPKAEHDPADSNAAKSGKDGEASPADATNEETKGGRKGRGKGRGKGRKKSTAKATATVSSTASSSSESSSGDDTGKPDSSSESTETAVEEDATADESAVTEAEPTVTEAVKKAKPAKKKAKKSSWKPLRESLKDPAGVDVWHAKDITVMPQQKKQRNRDRGLLAAWWIDDDAFVQLSTEDLEEVSLLNGQKTGIAAVNDPYEELKKFGPTLNDIYRIDTRTGESKKILEGLKYRLTESPSGRYMIYVRNNNLWTYDFETEQHADMTSSIDTSFVDHEIDQLIDEKRAYGVAAWAEGDARVLVYDKYDVWSLSPDGSSAERITHGADDMIRHRLVFLDKDAGRGFFARAPADGIDLSEPLYISLYGDRTKKTGYARKAPGGELVTLIEGDRRITSLQKAEEADVYVYQQEKFEESPNLFVTTADLVPGRQVTHTNAFQSEYLWGKTELITYTNKYGDVLQGSLAYPAGYQPGKRYPMIVHIYEKRSQNLHRYHSPSETNPYGHAVFTAGGYFMFEPDIVYRPQNPGVSAVECVLPAVEKVLSTGMIDPQRIGLMGHSWGAYQTAFIVTQTDVFAAGVAGAPLTDMISMSMQIYWSSGTPNSWIFHEGQGRMDQPFWRDSQTYIDNSPIYHIDKMDTPLLVTFGTEDGAVDWSQGVEMYNAARLAEKPLVMLVYEGEGHGLRKKENQVDYHYRVLEWFGHYLKGDEAKKWITEGVSHEDRQKQLKEKKGGGSAPTGSRGPGGRGRR